MIVITMTKGEYMAEKIQKEESKSGDQESAQGILYGTYVSAPVVLADAGYAVYTPVDIGLDYTTLAIPEGAELYCQTGLDYGTYVGAGLNPLEAGLCFLEYYVY